jgi:hypothetical protein
VTYLRTLGLGDVDLSRAAGSADQERGWPPSEPAESVDWTARIGELVAIAERLEYLIEREYIAPWLRTSIPAAGWSTPLDLIGQGRAEQVVEVIEAVES